VGCLEQSKTSREEGKVINHFENKSLQSSFHIFMAQFKMLSKRESIRLSLVKKNG
jgi:hypothetical protein